jgi:hypothetical protein
VDDDAMVAMARSAVCRTIAPKKNRLVSLQTAVLGGLIKKRFLLSAAAYQLLSALPNC